MNTQPQPLVPIGFFGSTNGAGPIMKGLQIEAELLRQNIKRLGVFSRAKTFKRGTLLVLNDGITYIAKKDTEDTDPELSADWVSYSLPGTKEKLVQKVHWATEKYVRDWVESLAKFCRDELIGKRLTTINERLDQLEKRNVELEKSNMALQRSNIDFQTRLAEMERAGNLKYFGVFEERPYPKGAAVTFKGSIFVALRDTQQTEAPETSPLSWQLAVKRGKDSR